MSTRLRWRERSLLIVPLLAIIAVLSSLLFMRHSHKQTESLHEHPARYGNSKLVGGDVGEHAHEEAEKGEETTEEGADTANSEGGIRRHRAGPSSSWEASAIAALREKSGSDPRRAFKLIETFGALLPRIRQIVRIPVPTRQVFRSYIAASGLPVVMTGMFDKSPLRSWTWESLKQQYGKLEYADVRQGQFLNISSAAGKAGVNRVGVRLSDFIDVVTGARKPRGKKEEELYIAKKQLLPSKEVLKVFPFPPFYTGDMTKCFTEPSSWVGMAGTYTQGHIDARDNFAYQIIGRKRWTLFSPQDHKHLYFKKLKGTLEWSAALAMRSPDLKQFPKFRKARPLTVVVEPGDVLYLPRGWVHLVENITPALMLNVWRKGPAEFLASWSEKYRNEITNICDKQD